MRAKAQYDVYIRESYRTHSCVVSNDNLNLALQGRLEGFDLIFIRNFRVDVASNLWRHVSNIVEIRFMMITSQQKMKW